MLCIDQCSHAWTTQSLRSCSFGWICWCLQKLDDQCLFSIKIPLMWKTVSQEKANQAPINTIRDPENTNCCFFLFLIDVRMEEMIRKFQRKHGQQAKQYTRFNRVFVVLGVQNTTGHRSSSHHSLVFELLEGKQQHLCKELSANIVFFTWSTAAVILDANYFDQESCIRMTCRDAWHVGYQSAPLFWRTQLLSTRKAVEVLKRRYAQMYTDFARCRQDNEGDRKLRNTVHVVADHEEARVLQVFTRIRACRISNELHSTNAACLLSHLICVNGRDAARILQVWTQIRVFNKGCLSSNCIHANGNLENLAHIQICICFRNCTFRIASLETLHLVLHSDKWPIALRVTRQDTDSAPPSNTTNMHNNAQKRMYSNAPKIPWFLRQGDFRSWLLQKSCHFFETVGLSASNAPTTIGQYTEGFSIKSTKVVKASEEISTAGLYGVQSE